MKNARQKIWHLESGHENANVGAAPQRRTDTDRQSHSRQAEMQQGEQEVRHTVEHFRCVSKA